MIATSRAYTWLKQYFDSLQRLHGEGWRSLRGVITIGDAIWLSVPPDDKTLWMADGRIFAIGVARAVKTLRRAARG